MVHHSVCPLCSSESISPHFRCVDHFLSGEKFEVYKCAVCTFEFTQDVPEEKEIGKYYESDDYISHNDSSRSFSGKLYYLARNVMLRKKKNIIKGATGLNKGSLLDIGSGTGHFAGALKKAGWLVKGIEISEKARNLSISQFGLDVIDPGHISTLGSDSFDCITLWHVLEHFQDPYNYAAEIRRLLKPGGICIVALPNCSSFDANYYGAFWAAYDVPRHLWHFNPSAFALFSKKTGFIQERISVLPLDVFYISQLSEKYKGSKIPLIMGTVRALLFAVLSVFNKERGSSIIYILRKVTGQ